MAIQKTGIANSTRGVSPVPNSSNLSSQLTNLKNQIVAARVTDIVLDENHPQYDRVGKWSGIGAIFYEFINQSGVGSSGNYALPVFCTAISL